jgi:hypothetical protein
LLTGCRGQCKLEIKGRMRFEFFIGNDKAADKRASSGGKSFEVRAKLFEQEFFKLKRNFKKKEFDKCFLKKAFFFN